jgi:hypothetical protein
LSAVAATIISVVDSRLACARRPTGVTHSATHESSALGGSHGSRRHMYAAGRASTPAGYGRPRDALSGGRKRRGLPARPKEHTCNTRYLDLIL